jgi:adenosylcobinamide kinase / adenosylcobinamide-phosphate guanylyltransferase
MIYLITGGERSGKSSYAQQLALELSGSPVYVATARLWDDSFRERIKRHQQERDNRWTNLEEEKNISRLDLTGKVAVIDCVTLWLTNFFTDTGYDLDNALKQAKEEADKLLKSSATLLIITNEIGMGVHAETPMGRRFVELQGWMNQHLAKHADKVILMVSGIAVTIKPAK